MSKKTSRSLRLLIIGAFSVMGLLIFMMFNSETDNYIVNLALKKGDKTYVYSKIGAYSVKTSIEKMRAPVFFLF